MCVERTLLAMLKTFLKKKVIFLTIIFDLFFKNAPPLEKLQYLKLQQREERRK